MICGTCGTENETASTGDCPKCKGPLLLAGRYRLLEVLGRGANGITYRAERVSDGHAFAVKEIPLRTLESAKAMELFEREARVLRELSHEAIPAYEDDFVFGEGKNAGLYLVQELVSGETLEEEASSKRYDLREVLAIVAEIADILDYLHRRSPPVVHRDIKPKNVMRRDDGRLVLIDFGSVRDALEQSGGSTVAGTFGYMAPEQLSGKATPASDIYALGALALALLTRQEPETLVTDGRTIEVRAHVEGPEVSLALLEQMVDATPANRPRRATEVAERARAARTARAVSERPAAPVKPAREPRKPTPPKREPKPSLEEAASRKRMAWIIGGIVTAFSASLVVVLAAPFSGSQRTREVAKSELGVPELYARPAIADVNGDGVEDVILVTAIDGGPQRREDDDDKWGQENGRFVSFVQAIDGQDGHVLYSIPQGKAFTSLGTEGKTTSERVVLVTRGSRLGVARIPATGEANITIHELASGKEIKKLSFPASSGSACQNEAASPTAPKGTFWFAGPGGGPGTTIDLEHATSMASKQSSCAPFATPNVADVPEIAITDRTTWTPRFSHEMTLRKAASSTWGGREVVKSGRFGVFINDKNVVEKPANVPTITIDNGGPSGSDRDSTKIDVVAFDLGEGKTQFERSLASLGFATETLDHLEGTDAGPLLFFKGSRGLARLDDTKGDKLWSLALPKGHRLSSYTLTKTRAYLHVFGPDNSVYGFLSKKLGSRVLVVDLAKGTYVRSIPAGALELEPEAAKAATYDPALFKPVAGCECALGRGDGGTGRRARLGMYVRSSIESGGKKRFSVAYALDVGGETIVLPPYVSRRTTISPPQTLEGDVSLAIACNEDAVVFVADKVATAWSISKQDELWSVDLPVARVDPKTTLGGGVALSCVAGTIDEPGLVHVPSSSAAAPKELVLKLADGTVEPAAPKKGR
jgi:hypothetical protein